jgi:single-stranded-DNA-specific exonuclease
LLTLDCGIKAVEKVAYANTKGIEVIICDHHVPGSKLPEALAILDPKRSDCEYPFKELTGCGIGYKLAVALHQQLLAAGHRPKQTGFDPEKELLDLLALSIACDIVPLVGENRTLAYYGLKKMRVNPQKGIKAIMDLSDRERSWDISDLVFFIGPHVNAAGRLGHAMEAVSVLLGKKKDLLELASALGDSNQARKDLDQQITEEACELIIHDQHHAQRNSTVLYKESWHKGVIGIVASRLIERYYRPTVLLTKADGHWVGSARSVMGFNLYEALEACQEHILQFGGHMYAAGLTIKDEMLPAFSDAFEHAVSTRITPEQKEPVLMIDQQITFDQLSDHFVRLIQRMGPFGPQNMTPVFMCKNVEVLEAKTLKEVHVRLVLKQHGIVFTAIGFQLAEKWERLNCLELDIAFQPTFNTWKDRTTINLVLKDIQKST